MVLAMANPCFPAAFLIQPKPRMYHRWYYPNLLLRFHVASPLKPNSVVSMISDSCIGRTLSLWVYLLASPTFDMGIPKS